MARKTLTDEEKAKKAADKAAKEEAAKEKGNETPASDKDAEVEALKRELAEARAETEKAQAAADDVASMREQLAAMQEQLAAAQRPQVITVAADTEKVQFLWQAEVADDNVTTFGDGGMYGRIVGKTGVFYVPKSDLSRVLNAMNRYFLDQRQLIVISGMTEEEREAMGVDYKEGEILDRKAFARMVELEKGILELYPALCDSHKEMVAKRYNEAYAAGNPHVKRNVVVELNRMARDCGREGDFRDIIEKMNAADLAE